MGMSEILAMGSTVEVETFLFGDRGGFLRGVCGAGDVRCLLLVACACVLCRVLCAAVLCWVGQNGENDVIQGCCRCFGVASFG